MIVQFLPAARQDLVDAAQWYLEDGGPAVAEQLGSAVERAVQLLAQMPQIGTAYNSGPLRTWPPKRYPYTVVYRVQGDVLTVMAVAHQSREPGYWVGRR